MTAEIPVPLPTTAATSADLARIAAELDALIERVRRAEKDHAAALADCTPALRDSARNLVHYLALRQVEAEIASLEEARAAVVEREADMEARVAAAIEDVAARVEALAARVSGAGANGHDEG